MAITVQSLVDRARRTLFDMTAVRWTDPELVDYVNDAQCQIVLYRPDAGARVGMLACVPGSRQDLGAAPAASSFTGASVIRVLRVFRSIRPTTSTAPQPFDAGLTGNAVRESNRLALDTEIPNWHAHNAGAANVDVQHYTFDLFDPKRIYVYPPVNRVNPSAAGNVFLEVLYSAVPATLDLASDIETLGLGDQYVNAIMDWVLYRAYMKDTTYAGNVERAFSHLNSFAAGLGIALKNGMRASIPSGADRTLMRAPGESP